jgi:hypothetical protein
MVKRVCLCIVGINFFFWRCAMESGNVWKKFVKLLWSVLGLLVGEKRSVGGVNKLLQLIIERPNPETILDRPSQASVDTNNPADGWVVELTRFYQEVLGMTVDLSGVKIPDDSGGFGWVVMVTKGLTLNRVYAKCRDLFPCSSYYGDNLDNKVPKNDRVSQDDYARRFRNRVEADEENKNTSANQLTKQAGDNITLLERLLLELWYHWKTGGGHLDLLNWTMCAGSRCRVGDVPCVYWRGGEFRVRYVRPDFARGFVRPRSAV